MTPYIAVERYQPLFGAKPLREPMLTSCESDPSNHISLKVI